MTNVQATALLAQLLATYPRADLQVATTDLYHQHLRALPADRATQAVRRLIMSATFLPSIAEIVAACEVGGPAIDQLVEAIQSGQELVPDLGSLTGWAVGKAAWPIPQVIEDMAALPAPAKSVTPEQRAEMRRRLAGLAASWRVPTDGGR